ncbi:SAM-dependent methyltransferase [Paenibacillus selenitireducens]|uniref:SAM-dependent methyltransferase n=1 Tax=Paenibacillus selenitireducens TaxID=1324314 RepID=A0A1T2XK78_9BACL|nr:class I SAM-dependent methyltransferase [Paenibacillus selenitireducens]OPA80287.1 SAM-dependent methyltransferase [Paenibacillus selenitireducens]
MSEWFERSFGEDYLIVYRHRDLHGAYQEVHKMINWLGLPAGAKVLDLCCGMGRHSVVLADQGYEVTGVDLSDVLLCEAKKQDTDNRIKWIQSDMRELPLQGGYDAVVNLFTSFGYFESDEENMKVLYEIKRMLKPGAPFIIDYLNPIVVENSLVPFSEKEEEGVKIVQYRKIENGYVKKEIVIQDAGRDERRYLERVKLYRLDQFEEMLDKVGLQLEQVHGTYDESTYDEVNSPRMIFVGRG